MTKVTNYAQDNITTFEDDLTHGWKLIRHVDNKGNEVFDFVGGNAHIRLGNDSCKNLREIMRR